MNGMSPSNRVAIVTGANKGLGLAIVEGLCKSYNGKVYLTSRDGKRGEDACEQLNKQGMSPVFRQLDVTDAESITNFTSYIKNNGEEIEILVNNAGILFLKDAIEPKIYQAEQTMTVNFFSLVNFTEAVLPFLAEGGRIVNISSSSGHLSRIPSEELRRQISAENLSLEELKRLMHRYVEDVRKNVVEAETKWGSSSYVVSKVAVNAYTFMLHRRLFSRGIFTNCVHPGYVKTDMTHGVGSVTPTEAVSGVLEYALKPQGSGLYVWHNGATVPWDGIDPRRYIDCMDV